MGFWVWWFKQQWFWFFLSGLMAIVCSATVACYFLFGKHGALIPVAVLFLGMVLFIVLQRVYDKIQELKKYFKNQQKIYRKERK